MMVPNENISPITQRLLTIPEACAAAKFGRTRAYAFIKEGKLRTVKIGRSRRVPVAALDDFIKSCGEPA